MKKYTSWIITGVAVVLIFAGIIWYAGRPGKYDEFATCIKDSGAIFYGAFWCPHCQEQKALFGKSASKLPYTECSTLDGKSQLPVCIENKIESYPTWIFKDGTKKGGTLSLSDLSEKTNCPYQK
jgi:hypothetical protein